MAVFSAAPSLLCCPFERSASSSHSLSLVLYNQAEDARQIKISSPVLNAAELAAIRDLDGFKTATLQTVYPLEKGPGGLQVRLWHAGVRVVSRFLNVCFNRRCGRWGSLERRLFVRLLLLRYGY